MRGFTRVRTFTRKVIDMRTKITDFLLTMGEICDKHNGICGNCPFCVDDRSFHGCLKDDMSNPKHAKMIKDITLKYMKDRRTDTQ